MDKYNPQAIEAKWQRIWEQGQHFAVHEDPRREKFYLLVMFPYPSGRIHMGHVRNYAIGDLIARYQRMRGRNVLHPMGWDAFGMPAENAAIQQGIHPRQWTYQNIDTMRRELKSMGLSYDWSREFATCDLDYAHWEQRLFLKLYDKGLVYRKRSLVNWDPVDQTVLANEQVIDGRGWRSGALVERRELSQWFMRITAYADELLEDLKILEGWPETVRIMQENWIGRSHGVSFSFRLQGRQDLLPVYTTRPDTIMGVTFCSVAPEHPLAQEVAGRDPAALAFIRECQQAGTSEETLERMEKKGFDTGLRAIHPLTGEAVPIFIANFVLMSYGSGAVMAVPGHDQRDFEFARKFGLPIRVVIQPPGVTLDPVTMTEAHVGPGLLVHAGEFDGLDNETAKQRVAETFASRGIGQATINYRLRDWGISRQRYWGNPIPMIHCPACGVVPVPEQDLPVALPEDVSFLQTGNPLENHPTWQQTTCPRCRGLAKRETDTMDTFMESSWYFLRYCCADLATAPLDRDRVDAWMPVDQYVGGIEHAVLHLLYARFFHKALRDVDQVSCREPFTRLLTQGMVRKDTHRCPEHGWRYPSETRPDGEGGLVCVACNRPIQVGRNEKMSKSKHNVVDPNDLIADYGADTARVFMLFAAPPSQDLEWSDSGVDGAWRFLNRVWRLILEIAERTPGVAPADTMPAAGDLRKLRGKLHQTMAKVTTDIDRQSFNTGIAAVMELVNDASQAMARQENWQEAGPGVFRELAEAMVLLLAPYAPHMAEELWQRLGHADSLSYHPWPTPDPAALVRDEITLVIQIDGKLRARLQLPANLTPSAMETAALADPRVQAFLVDRQVRKVVVVPGKLVNIVTGPK